MHSSKSVVGAIRQLTENSMTSQHESTTSPGNLQHGKRNYVALLTAAASAAYYITISISLTLFNKLLFQRHSLEPVHILLAQCITTLTVLQILSAFRLRSAVSLNSLSPSQLCTHLPLLISYMGMLLFGMAALSETSLLMYHTLRRTSIIPVLLLQWHFDRRMPTKYTWIATAVIVSGGSAAIKSNLRWEPKTYALAFSANITTAYYLTRLKHVRDSLNISNLQLVYLNNMFAFPLLLALFLANPPQAATWALFRNTIFTVMFVCSSLLAIVLNHAVYVNTTVNDAIAHTVSCQVKDMLLLIISVVFIDDAKYRSTGMLLGALVEFSGSVIFAIGKIKNASSESSKSSAGDNLVSTKEDGEEEEVRKRLVDEQNKR